MSDIAVKVEGLGKRYSLRHQVRQEGLRHVLQDALTSLWKPRAETEAGPAREDFWAISDVSFEVKRGEVFGIIGRNGAGKSTLLKILSRITEPSTGSVEIEGRVASLLEVGTGFHPELTGRENVYLNGAILGMSRAEIRRKFDEIVAFAEVEKFLDTPVKHYSSGMYVRLAFAVAAHLEPEILIVDEVLAVGDAPFQKKCLGKMRDVSSREGRTVLFVSHNIAAISQLCTKALLIEKGSLVKTGTVGEVTAAYLASFNSSRTSINLDEVERTGEGSVRFTNIWKENAQGDKCAEVFSGDKIFIVVQYRSKEAKPLRNVRVSLALRNSIGQVLVVTSTDLTSSEDQDVPSEGVFRCCFPRIPLSGGRYPFVAYLEVNKILQDRIETAGFLDVNDGDFYGSGKLYPPGWQGKCVLVDHYWETPSTVETSSHP
jgi:lipopolysaccharide transport system ATP-binding protein